MRQNLSDEELEYLRELWNEQTSRGSELPAVLLVDDDTQFLAELSELIRGEGLPCYTSEDAEQALVRMREHPAIQILVLDLKMPGMSGLELVWAIKWEFGDRFSFMMVSGHGRMQDVQDAMHEDVLEFISKPLDVEQFLERFYRVLWVATKRDA